MRMLALVCCWAVGEKLGKPLAKKNMERGLFGILGQNFAQLLGPPARGEKETVDIGLVSCRSEWN